MTGGGAAPGGGMLAGTAIDLRNRIAASWHELTPTECRVAAALQNDPDLLLMRTSRDIAERTGTSKATVSRLVRALGFRDVAEARASLRAGRGSGVPWAAGDGAPADRQANETRNLGAALASLERAGRRDLAERIIAARRVVVIGWRNAFPVALQLRAQLAQIRPGVILAPQPGQSIGEDIADLSPHDVVIVVSVRRHVALVAEVIRRVSRSGADLIVLGDLTAAVIAVPARTAILCPVDTSAAFDSHASVYAVVAALTSDAYDASGAAGRARVAAVAGTYADLDELEQQ